MELTKHIKNKTLIAICLFLMSISASAQTSVWNGGRDLWSSGSGTSNDPYLIESAENLAFLAYMVNKGFKTDDMYFRLVTDIDLKGDEGNYWEPIGLGDRWFYEDGCDRGILDANTSFNGHFDGGYHHIFNISVDETHTNAGLFGSVCGRDGDYAVIENVFVASGSIKGDNCGGIVGKGSYINISCCWNGTDIEGNNGGGIIGDASDFSINNCYNTGYVSGNIAGGIIGVAQNTKQMSNSYNVGEVSNTGFFDCLLGQTINDTANVENCHYLNSCGQSDYGTSQDDFFMKSMEFVNILNSNNPQLIWACDANSLNNGYPILAKDIFVIEATVNLAIGGVVEGSGYYGYGATCTVTANANPEYCFIGWEESGSIILTDSIYSFTVTENKTLIANFVDCDDIDENSTTVRVFPNPATDCIFVLGTNILNIKIINMFGQVIDEFDGKKQNSKYIDVKKYPAGTYFIKISLTSTNTLVKLVKL